ncbi:MAG: trypsin-like peptidase domain-containing protein [Agriterribacter sp.]
MRNKCRHIYLSFGIVAIILVSNLNVFGQQRIEDISSIVVLVEKEDSFGNLIVHGTGFLLVSETEAGKSIFVTNEHLLKNQFIYLRMPVSDSARDILVKSRQTSFSVDNRFWTFDGFNLYTKVNLTDGSVKVAKDIQKDIAVFSIGASITTLNNGKALQVIKNNSLRRDLVGAREGPFLGDDIMFIGFPYAIGSRTGYKGGGNYSSVVPMPVVRKGSLAWKKDGSSYFLVDGFSYSGNSGGPVFKYDRENPELIGVVSAHLKDEGLPMADVNYGLVHCVRIEEVLELIKRL